MLRVTSLVLGAGLFFVTGCTVRRNVHHAGEGSSKPKQSICYEVSFAWRDNAHPETLPTSIIVDTSEEKAAEQAARVFLEHAGIDLNRVDIQLLAVCKCYYRGDEYSPGSTIMHEISTMTRTCCRNGAWRKGTEACGGNRCEETLCYYQGEAHSLGAYRWHGASTNGKFCQRSGAWGPNDPVR